MGLIITIANQKGGVGKTITASTMAAILHEEGAKVLIISLDPQRNLDMVAGKDIPIPMNDLNTFSMLHVMKGSCTIEEAIIESRIGDIVRASSHLSQWQGSQIISKAEYQKVRNDLPALQKLLDERILNNDESTHVLADRLSTVRDKYDYIIIDTNPSLTLLTVNALYACDYVIIPAFSEETSLSAIAELYSTIKSINYYNPWHKTQILGILMTRCNIYTIAFKRHVRKYTALAAKMETKLFSTYIRQSARAVDYVESKTDLLHYDPKGKTTEDYIAFVEEFKKEVAERSKQ